MQELQRQLWKVKTEQEKRDAEESRAKEQSEVVGKGVGRGRRLGQEGGSSHVNIWLARWWVMGLCGRRRSTV